MAPVQMELHGTVFPSALNPPYSGKTLFLGGAGVRGVHIMNGQFKVVSLHGVYLEPEATNFLTGKWRGKTVEELSDSNQFFQDIITGPFDKLLQITLVAHLGGKEYAEKVIESCTVYLKKNCLYSQKEEEAAEELYKLFEPIDLPPGSTVFFTCSASGHLMVTISKDTSLPEVENGVIKCANFSEALLGSSIGEDGVCPAAKLSLASRICDIVNE